MNSWMIPALLREAEQTRNNHYLTNAERAERLEAIRAEVVAAGGDGALVGVPNKPRAANSRATRTNKTATTRRKGNS